MTQILDMYRAVKLVEDTADKQAKVSPPPQQLSGYQAWHPATNTIKEDFVNKYGVSPSKSNGIVADAIKNRYLEGVTGEVSGVKIDTLCVTTNGRGLIEKAFGLLPVGLWLAWFGRFGKFAIGFVVGLLVPMLFYAIKLIVELVEQ